MLAANVEDRSQLLFPLFATPKIDGIRAISNGDMILSRTIKPIPNKFIQAELKGLPTGMDGELFILGKSFSEVQSAIMSEESEPDFVYMIFDYIDKGFYVDRVKEAANLVAISGLQRCKILHPIFIGNLQQLETYEKQCIESGYEGVCLRAGNSPYKMGRSTFREHYLLKLKTFLDSEAFVIGFKPLFRNDNAPTIDNLGHTKRSHHQANKVEQPKLGALQVRWGVEEFDIGSGFTDAERYEIWNNKEKYIGQTVTFKYQPHGTKDAPRTPIFKGFRLD